MTAGEGAAAQAEGGAGRPGRVARLLGLGWLNSERVVLYGTLLLVFCATILVAGILLRDDNPGRVDFLAFQAAARLALGGEAAAAYDPERLREVQAEILGVPTGDIVGYLGWLNPPHFFFVVMPFGPPPYAWAWFGWILFCIGVLAVALRSVMPGPAAVVAVLGTPSVLISLGVGQNGALVAALLAWTLALMDRRPLAAGVALGLLTIKPQFGLLFPLLLALTGRWRVFGAAAASALAAMAASWLAFGTDAWRGFLPVISGTAGRHLTPGSDSLARIQSVHSWVMHETGQPVLAWTLHGVVALGVVALVLRLWLRRPEGPEEARAAAAIAGAFLVTPYVWTYDTPALGLAALFLARAGRRDGWLAGEKALLLLTCTAIVLVVAWRSYPAVAPLAWLAILGFAWRRDRAWRLSPARRGSMSAGT